MGAGTEVFNQVINQQGSPALFSAILANRPAFGYTGRIFISTDTREIYRDTGTSWELIGSGVGSVNIYNSNGTLSAQRTVNLGGNDLRFDDAKNGAALVAIRNTQVTGNAVEATISVQASGSTALGRYGVSHGGYKFIQAGQGFVYSNDNALNILQDGTGIIKFGAGGSGVPQMTLTSLGRLLLGTTVDAGFLADINGTLRVQGSITQSQSPFAGSLTFSTTGNNTHRITASGLGNFLQFGPSNAIFCNADFQIPAPFDLYIGETVFQVANNQYVVSGFIPGNDTKSGYTFFANYNNVGAGGLNTGFAYNISPAFVNATVGTYNLITTRVNPTYNFTGGTNNVTGILYSPVITNAVGIDHIAIQTELGRCNFLETQAAAVSGRANYSTFSRLTQNLAAGGSVGGGSFYTGAALLNVSNFAGSYTFGSASINGGGYSGSTLNFSGSGTVTMNQAGLRTFAGHQIFNQFGGSASGTISHFAGMQILGLYNQNTGVITPSITNAYGLVINDLNDYSHTFTLANRWGIYQTGPIDHNYFAGKLLTGTTVVTPRQVHIGGDMEFTTTTSNTHGGASGLFLNVWVNGTQYKIELRNI